MKVLPNLEIIEEDIDFLYEHKNRKFNNGGESNVYIGNRKNTLYKIFVDSITDKFKLMDDNKLEKIKRQYESPLEHSVQPLRTITLFGDLVGYEMTYDEDDIPLLDAILTKDEKLIYLKKTRDVLEYYHSKDVIYGDIKNDNILINSKTGEIKFCDMDNVYMQELPIDIMGQELEDFYEIYGKVDGTEDAYMHNLLTLSESDYNAQTPTQIAQMLKQGEITKLPSYEEEAIKIIKEMQDLSTYQSGYLIDYVKKKV